MKKAFIFRQCISTYKRGLNTLYKVPTTLSGNKAEKSEPITNRKLFRAIQPDRKVLEYLDSLHLGYCAKRRARVAIARRLGNGLRSDKSDGIKEKSRALSSPSTLNSTIPYPFTDTGRALYEAKIFPELRAKSGLIPEVAIIGRSNVGKSTLVNTLLGFDNSYLQKAIVSPKPGTTNQLHFYGLGKVNIVREPSLATTLQLESRTLRNSSDKKRQSTRSGKMPPSLVVVDMPGYGFAFLNDEDRIRCETLSYEYLVGRGPSLKRVVLLLDARHGFKQVDKLFFQGLFRFRDEYDRKRLTEASNTEKPKTKLRWHLQVVLTKCDLIERTELARRMKLVRDEISEALPGLNTSLAVIPVSGKEVKGVAQLQRELASLCSVLNEDKLKRTANET